MDLFVVPTISFRLLHGLLIMGQGRPQILWFGVTAHPTAEWIGNQLKKACGWEQAPRYLIRDRDGAYGEIFIRRVRLANSDRRFFVQLYRWFPSVLQVLAIIRPETLIHCLCLPQIKPWHIDGAVRPGSDDS